MLISLFGVILRFRENPIAIVGDISKMYHMVPIPLIDQHVHRFVWRNCEIDREPDIYAKTILTFGVQPAPAMATTAMRKTASLKENEKPRAVEAVTKMPMLMTYVILSAQPKMPRIFLQILTKSYNQAVFTSRNGYRTRQSIQKSHRMSRS